MVTSDKIEYTAERLKTYSYLTELLYSLYFSEVTENPELKTILRDLPLDKIREEIKDYRGSCYITDMPSEVIEVYPQVMEEFYLNYGFEISKIPTDHVLAEIAFMAKMVSIELQFRIQNFVNDALNLLRNECRFMNTHLKPLILALEEKSALFRDNMAFIIHFILKDANYLHATLVSLKKD